MTKRAPTRRTKVKDTEAPTTTPAETLQLPMLPSPPKTPPIFLGSETEPEALTGPARLRYLLDRSCDRARVGKIEDKVRVTLMRDHTLIYPDLWLEVFIAGSRSEENAFAEMFARAACKKAATIEDADLVVFTGGADVDPQLYGAVKHKDTYFHAERDTMDIEVYQKCLNLGIPMFGVCRGAQFLWVMNGGKLYQDVDNHNGAHTMFDVRELRQIEKVSSVHHQMCIWDEKLGFELVATSSVARNRWKDPKLCVRGTHADVEAYFCRDTCCFGVQGHPEYKGYNFFTKWCLDRLNEFVIINPDVTWKNTRRRLRSDVIDMRDNPLKMPANSN